MRKEATIVRYLTIATEREAISLMEAIGVDPYGVTAMVPKMFSQLFYVDGLSCKVANILKQEMLSIGGDVAVARETVACTVETTDALIMGTEKQMFLLAEKLSRQPFGLREIGRDIVESLHRKKITTFSLETPRRTIDLGERTLVMGIVNVTPDSFSDGGRFEGADDAVEHACTLLECGADIIDIGGESSRPGAEAVTLEEERARVIPVISALTRRVSVPISIDTRKAAIASEAIDAGAEIVNDISALTHDNAMADVIARYGVPVVLMHMRGVPETMQTGDLTYRCIRGDIIAFFRERIEAAVGAGIAREKIILDPGIGFGKTAADNMRLLKHLGEFAVMGCPLLVGTSRKSFIGAVTGQMAEDRLEGTAATVTAAIMKGAHMVRVHDVRAMKHVVNMTDALVRS